MIATPHRSYQFIGTGDTADHTGGSMFKAMLSMNKNKRFFELPGENKSSMLALFSTYPLSPTTFAHLGGCGIHYSAMNFDEPIVKKTAEGSVLTVLKDEPLLWQVGLYFSGNIICWPSGSAVSTIVPIVLKFDLHDTFFL